jgi:hypothetical protein
MITMFFVGSAGQDTALSHLLRLGAERRSCQGRFGDFNSVTFVGTAALPFAISVITIAIWVVPHIWRKRGQSGLSNLAVQTRKLSQLFPVMCFFTVLVMAVVSTNLSEINPNASLSISGVYWTLGLTGTLAVVAAIFLRFATADLPSTVDNNTKP